MKKYTWAVAVALCLVVTSSVCAAALAAEMIPVGKGQKLAPARDVTFADDAPARVEAPYEFKMTGMLGGLGFGYRVRAGSYTALKEMDYAGRVYILVPAEDVGAQGDGSLTPRAACTPTTQKFVAIDRATGAILSKPVGLIRGCDIQGEILAFDREMKPVAVGRLYLPSPSEQAELTAAATKQRVESAQSAARATKARNDATRAKKSEIGAKVCKIVGDTLYTGFTEAVSPDNGKLKIQIVQAAYVRSPGWGPSGFSPTMTWANPDEWDLCPAQ